MTKLNKAKDLGDGSFVSSSHVQNESSGKGDHDETDFALVKFPSGKNKVWRMQLPFTRDKYRFSLISFLRSTIGKDLTRVTMPVHFNEPLSFLQRLTEDIEYASVLNKAAECTCPSQRLAFVAAFASSVYANVPGRFWKPFNPLLGETFEYVNERDGIAVIAEQVSHHPPVSALHAETSQWIFWEEYKLDTRFRGYYVKIVPTGVVHLKFKSDGHHYSWTKPKTSIHNIIIGELWVDHDGDVEVLCHQTREKAVVHFQPYRRSHLYKQLKGEVFDSKGVMVYNLDGSWEEGLSALPVDGNAKIDLWKAVAKPENAAKNYGFTFFALQLNDFDEDVTCPTDSRFRPDQRQLENGKLDEAADTKHRLEEKQRAAKKHRDHRKEVWSPRWFRYIYDEDTDTSSYVYNGAYWKAKASGNYEDCPDIF